jgi:hypothetical protein
MVIGEVNTLSNLTNVGITSAILNVNLENYRINKELLDISQKVLDKSSGKELLDILTKIEENQEKIIQLLENKESRGLL